MKAEIYDLNGKGIDSMELPSIFSTRVRHDLIIRSFLSTMSKKRQPHGTDKRAGQKSSASYRGRRRGIRWSMMGREMARMPRLHGKIPGYLMYRARTVPQSVKGRTAHPPKTEKIWTEKMNKKERKLAIISAIAATSDKDLIIERGHIVDDVKSVPIIVEDAIESIKKTSEIYDVLELIGLEKELDRVKKRKIRSGKGPSRGRKYKQKIGPLIVVSNDNGISRAARNIPGVHVSNVKNLSVEYLAPGAMSGRIVVFSKSAIEELGENNG